jgi:hypothetical protein
MDEIAQSSRKKQRKHINDILTDSESLLLILLHICGGAARTSTRNIRHLVEEYRAGRDSKHIH